MTDLIRRANPIRSIAALLLIVAFGPASARAQVRSTEPDVFVVGRDEIVAEHRGSTLIERYVDPNDPGLPDFATEAFAKTSIDPYYRIRVVRKKQFAP